MEAEARLADRAHSEKHTSDGASVLGHINTFRRYDRVREHDRCALICTKSVTEMLQGGSTSTQLSLPSTSEQRKSEPSSLSGTAKLLTTGPTSSDTNIPNQTSLTLKETRERINLPGALKQMEMTARRGLAFAALHDRHLAMYGNEVLASCNKPEMSDPTIKRLGKEVWPGYYWQSPSWLEYGWCFDYWLSGGHDRGLQNILQQLPPVNRKQVLDTMVQYD